MYNAFWRRKLVFFRANFAETSQVIRIYRERHPITTNMYVLIKMVKMFIAFKADSSIATTEKTAVILLKRSPSDGSNLVQ